MGFQNQMLKDVHLVWDVDEIHNPLFCPQFWEMFALLGTRAWIALQSLVLREGSLKISFKLMMKSSVTWKCVDII